MKRPEYVMRPITMRLPKNLVILAEIYAATNELLVQNVMTEALESYLRARGVDVSVMPTASTPTATAA